MQYPLSLHLDAHVHTRQILNTYMGTSLRSMDEVLSGNGNTAVMIAQVLAAILVSYFVNQKMKQEVHLVMMSRAYVTPDSHFIGMRARGPDHGP